MGETTEYTYTYRIPWSVDASMEYIEDECKALRANVLSVDLKDRDTLLITLDKKVDIDGLKFFDKEE